MGWSFKKVYWAVNNLLINALPRVETSDPQNISSKSLTLEDIQIAMQTNKKKKPPGFVSYGKTPTCRKFFSESKRNPENLFLLFKAV